MSVDYEQLRLYVLEALAVDGPSGMMEPSAPAGVPHRMPAADPSKEEGDPKANKLYDMALVAREAAEELIEKLDEPIFDDAYEFAFKASAAMRRVLNSLEDSGAKPTPQQRVVAPSANQQKYAGAASYQGPSTAGYGSTVFGAHSPGVALSDLSEGPEAGVKPPTPHLNTDAKLNNKVKLKIKDINNFISREIADTKALLQKIMADGVYDHEEQIELYIIEVIESIMQDGLLLINAADEKVKDDVLSAVDQLRAKLQSISTAHKEDKKAEI